MTTRAAIKILAGENPDETSEPQKELMRMQALAVIAHRLGFHEEADVFTGLVQALVAKDALQLKLNLLLEERKHNGQ